MGQLNFKSLQTKILFGFLLLSLITIVVSSWAIYNFFRLSEATNNIMVENYRSVVAAENMMRALERQDSAELLFLFNQDPDSLTLFIENEEKFLSWLNRAEDNITIPQEAPLLDEIRKSYVVYLSKFPRLRETFERDGTEDAQQLYVNEIMPLFEDIIEYCQMLLETNQEAMVEANEFASASAYWATYSTIFVSITAVIISLILGFNIANVIIKPIRQLTNSVRKVAQGNLEQVIEIDSRDEIGALAQEFNKMTQQLFTYEQANISKLIAEQKKSEAIVRSISDGIIVTDAEYKILLVNHQGEHIFNIKEKNSTHNHFLEVINNETIFKMIKETMLSRRAAGSEEQRIIEIVQGNKKHFFKLEVTPVVNESRQLLGAVTLLKDITHYKEVDQLKSDFVSTVSHEFRSPLTSIVMGVGLLKSGMLGRVDLETQELLDALEEDCQRLIRLVNNLLDLSKLESGKINMEIEPVEVKSIVEASVAALKSQAEEKSIGILWAFPENLSRVNADYNKIIWVLTNLIGNALRYTENDGEIKILVEEKGNRLYFSVADNGTGIPEEYQDKIFEKFVQVPGKSGTNSGGAGLGLAIAKEIVQAHGGRIWVESTPDKGCTFTFTLPVSA
ncbi:sensor histidine kinase [Candidatus Contubernalis alkaliaceticus]|uniref:sensor histidine kinase n=1 Tax=Candidatus Contubernalis alkaliaceticus TaxID=338645 RepID=UPI001F4C4698|nr:ATP-binding protein [Candidatus Contubernalis alkalaceticus]UNC92258.1 HAMP domain-containing protein [Candidatus Contubernalis alkalaceticus]